MLNLYHLIKIPTRFVLHANAFFLHGLFEFDFFFQFAFLASKKRSNYVVFVFCCYCIKRAEELFIARYKILANNPYAISDIIILIGQLNDWLFACAVLIKQTLCRLNRLFRNISFDINEIIKMKFLEKSFYKQ